MLRKFLQCQTLQERVNLLTSSTLSEWSEQDINTVIEILGLKMEASVSKVDKISAIEKHLADYQHNVVQKMNMDLSKLDAMPQKDEGETLAKSPDIKKTIGVMLQDGNY